MYVYMYVLTEVKIIRVHRLFILYTFNLFSFIQIRDLDLVKLTGNTERGRSTANGKGNYFIKMFKANL